ncbi:MAG TPA: hypothetical protein P5513_08395 [Candidatus Diapherotrites archaeon]|nr:hypothetical protein [Candidatus Diapherotrites archaeon]
MSKHICVHCKYVAPTKDFSYRYTRDDDFSDKRKRVYCCPVCGSEFVEKAIICKKCNKYEQIGNIIHSKCFDCRMKESFNNF